MWWMRNEIRGAWESEGNGREEIERGAKERRGRRLETDSGNEKGEAVK